MAFFSHHSNLIQPIPTMAVAASLSHSTAPRQHVSSPAAQPSQQQLQKHLQQLGQPFLPSFDEPQAVSRPSKSKKNRRSAEVYSSIPKGTTSVAEKSPSSRMRMPSHTSLLLGLSLGPAFGDDENSAPVSGPLLLQHQLAEAQVPSQGGSKREQHGKRGSRGGSIARGKVTKAARLPLGGSPSFGLNILGLGDALDDAAFVYLEKDAQCQSPVPNIVITPPAVIVAHTPSRLARSESKAGTLLLLSMSDLGTAAADAGSKLAPAAISTDSPSVRSISSNLTMTSASATVNGGELLMGQVAAYDEPTVVSPPRSMSPPATARAGCAPGEWSQQHNFYSPPEVEVDPKVLSVIQQRMGEDQACFTELALEIDVILSEYIYINSPTQAWIVGRRLTTVLLNAIYGQGFAKVPPTLRKLRQVGEGMLPDDWVETESERLLEKVLDHVVTGILVVLADLRSPFETPQSLAQLCCSLKISLSSHNGSPHNTEVEIPCLSPYGGMASGQPSPPVNAPSQAPSRDLGLLFEEIVFANLRDILKKGEDVRDRACRLEVPLARKGNKKRWEMASSERVRAAADQQKIRKLAVKGLISGDEFVKLERRRAAKGNVRDQFADISVLRFVGELYRVSFIGLPDVQSWLERMLFDTVYPGVPSLYELGCACALITIIGPQLEAIADKEDRQAYVLSARHVSRILQPPSRPIPETPIRSKEQQMSRNWRRPLRPDAPANHWIQCSPAAAIRSPTSPFSSASVSTRTVSCGSGKLSLSSFGSMHSVQSSCSSNWSGSTPALSPPPTAKNEGNEARLTVTGCMDRLGELLKQDDAEEGVKEIIKSVLGLYFRGWVTSSIPFTPTRHAL
ncbi:unnamed protein product [Tilletia controversa]|uniref:MIF4G domain-containing protein n=4 Tax=Tilletia TaxID=13289 RepID=A0A8X7MZQ3_9BASI|nr:hypothetical protein A4X06_0g1476 [Tilletia controversa]CAD6942817.1 unnamed protein product [Tilletia caries]CAD6944116.1 unnamed protein product [Tilletia controversa]